MFAVTDPIALSVGLTTTIETSEGDTIAFDYVFIDTHNSYIPETGAFLIPQTGIYEVNVNLYKADYDGNDYDGAIVDLYVNDTPLARLRNDVAGSDTAHSSCTVIREFVVDDAVYVQTESSTTYFGDSIARSQFNVNYLGELA